LESKRAAHQANQEGVNFGRRSPGSGGQNCTPNNSWARTAIRAQPLFQIKIIGAQHIESHGHFLAFEINALSHALLNHR
jgi:hypothetical protein